MHHTHIHISTGFEFLVLLLILGAVALVFAFKRAAAHDRLEMARLENQRLRESRLPEQPVYRRVPAPEPSLPPAPQTSAPFTGYTTSLPNGTFVTPGIGPTVGYGQPNYGIAPGYPAPGYQTQQSTGLSVAEGLVGGMVLGEMIGGLESRGNHETIIENNYYDAPVEDGFSSGGSDAEDSGGFSYDSDSSDSGGDSGGFDLDI